jgi:hypothetical protein
MCCLPDPVVGVDEDQARGAPGHLPHREAPVAVAAAHPTGLVAPVALWQAPPWTAHRAPMVMPRSPYAQRRRPAHDTSPVLGTNES